MFKKSIVAGTMLIVASTANAQWSAGAGLINPSTPYLSADDELIVFPFVAYEGERLSFRGVSLQYKVLESKRGEPSLEVGIELAPNQFDVEDADELVGIEDRDFSFMGGLTYTHPTDFGNFGVSIQTEVIGDHGGERATVFWNRPIVQGQRNDWNITLGVEVEYLSEDYADYYFGVSELEAANSIFAAYDVDSVMQPSVTLGGFYSFNEKWMAIANFRVQQLASDVEYSPIIDASNTVDGFVGVLYRF